MRSQLRYAALGDDGYLVGIAHRGQAVGHDQGSSALHGLQIVQCGLDLKSSSLFVTFGGEGQEQGFVWCTVFQSYNMEILAR